MAVYEGKWNCTFCGETNRGRDMGCAGCGARRGSDVEFYLDSDAPEVTDEDQLRRANDGPDWLCETCGGSNRFGQSACETCGAPPGASRFREVVDQYMPGAPAGNEGQGNYSTNPQPGKRSTSPLIKLIISLVLAGLCLGACQVCSHLLTLPETRLSSESAAVPKESLRDVELVIDRVQWQRTIFIEDYRWVTRNDWKEDVPADARVISQQQALHHYDEVKIGSHTVQEYYTEQVKSGSHTVTESYPEQVSDGVERYKCGTRNKGNGFFESIYCTRTKYKTVTRTRSRQVDDYKTVRRSRDKVVDDFKKVPVYQTKVTYSIQRWVTVDSRTAQGTNKDPFWPKVSAGPRQREGERREIYQLFLSDTADKTKRYERAVSGDEFKQFTPGARCAAKISGIGQIAELLPPAKKD